MSRGPELDEINNKLEDLDLDKNSMKIISTNIK